MHLGHAQMPWKECKSMDERLRFIARLLEGKKMARHCREFGISRVTGYKIFSRCKDCSLEGLKICGLRLLILKSALYVCRRDKNMCLFSRSPAIQETLVGKAH